MTNIIPAPRGLWAIVATYPETEIVTFPGGATSEIGAGTPELYATPVLGFANSEDDEGSTYYPVTLSSDAHFAEPLVTGDPLFEFKAYVMTKGAPFTPTGLGKNVFTLDTLPEEYRSLLVSPSTQDATNATRETTTDERVTTTAELVYKKLAKAPMRENGVKRELRPERRPFTRDALRHLEDQGRAHYDGTHWHAVHTDTGERG